MAAATAGAAAAGPVWRLVLGEEGRLSRRIHQQLERLWAAKRDQQGDKAETAEALKAALDAGGEPWHVVIGPDDFVTNVRYRKERCFIYANHGAALRALVFQSSPLPPPSPSTTDAAAGGGAAAAVGGSGGGSGVSSAAAAAAPPAPKGVSVYASEWEDEDQEAAVLALLAEHVGGARGGGGGQDAATAASVALKAALTAQHGGPLWHVLIARDAVEMGAAVEAQPGTFLDARVVAGRGGSGGPYRVVVWRHDLPLSLASALRLQLLSHNAATRASVACLAIACTLTLLTQAGPALGLSSLDCDPCCHPDPAQRLGKECGGAACTAEAAAAAVVCLRVRTWLRWCALGFLAAAFVFKVVLAGPRVGLGAGRGGRGQGGGRRQRQGVAATGGKAGGKGKAKRR